MRAFTHRPLPSCTSIESRSSQEHLRRNTVKVNMVYDKHGHRQRHRERESILKEHIRRSTVKFNQDYDSYFSYFCYQHFAMSPPKYILLILFVVLVLGKFLSIFHYFAVQNLHWSQLFILTTWLPLLCVCLFNYLQPFL